ncbi:4305_t:CDS:10, partial [Dentiscutata heterogama]
CNSDWDVWLLEKRAVHETNAEVHRELNKVVSRRAIEPNEESLRKKQKQLDEQEDDDEDVYSSNYASSSLTNKSQLDEQEDDDEDVYSSNYASSSLTNKSCSQQQTSKRGKTGEDITVEEQERRENGVSLSDHDHNLVKNLLNELQQCSEKMASLVRSFQVYCDDSVNELIRNEIMDLTPSSEFVLRYTDEDDYMQVLKEIFEPVEKLFPESAIKFLEEFFSENCTHQQWDNRLENLLEPEEDLFLRKLKRFLFETLPALQKALWRFSDIHYIPGNQAIRASAYRKSIMKQKGNADRSDGIAYTTTEKPYEICIVEGSRPYVVDHMKEMSDYVQNARAGKDIINHTVVSEVKLKRAPPLQFKSYMVQSIGLSLRFYFMDYLGIYRLFEIETCEIPTDLEGVDLFPSFFRAVVTWALMVRGTDQEFRSVRNKRSVRYSNAHNLRVLSKINHNQPCMSNTKIIKEKKII